MVFRFLCLTLSIPLTLLHASNLLHWFKARRREERRAARLMKEYFEDRSLVFSSDLTGLLQQG